MVPATLPIVLKFSDKELPPKVVFLHTTTAILSDVHSHHYFYPIHLSQMFLLTPTLESTLYLLLLRLLHRQFEEAFQLADSCISDTKFSREAAQASVKQLLIEIRL
jgi:hypothetical protein